MPSYFAISISTRSPRKQILAPRTVVWWTLMLPLLAWIGDHSPVLQACSRSGWSGVGIHAFQPHPPTIGKNIHSRRPSKENQGHGIHNICIERTDDAHPGRASGIGKSSLGCHSRTRKFRSVRISNPLFAAGSNKFEPGNGEDANGNDTGSNPLEGGSSGKKRSFSMKRIGGRPRRGRGRRASDESMPVPSPSNGNNNSKSKWPLSGWITALLAFTLLKNLFFGGGNDADYYYYSYSSSSSSVYETRINPDGSRTTTETSRKESSDLKSNIPGLTVDQMRDGNRNSFVIDLYDDGF